MMKVKSQRRNEEANVVKTVIQVQVSWIIRLITHRSALDSKCANAHASAWKIPDLFKFNL